jgi:hypothetical protein
VLAADERSEGRALTHIESRLRAFFANFFDFFLTLYEPKEEKHTSDGGDALRRVLKVLFEFSGIFYRLVSQTREIKASESPEENSLFLF